MNNNNRFDLERNLRDRFDNEGCLVRHAFCHRNRCCCMRHSRCILNNNFCNKADRFTNERF